MKRKPVGLAGGIGKADTSIDESKDGFTFATERNPFDEVTTVVAP